MRNRTQGDDISTYDTANYETSTYDFACSTSHEPTSLDKNGKSD
ncbi:hypothetical protein [Corynebacterium glutamicum]|nr:hypothetical protein [Corynebacterium glutamicum]NII87125.1 hypothetical protein [Corynebacterium glutamicum]